MPCPLAHPHHHLNYVPDLAPRDTWPGTGCRSGARRRGNYWDGALIDYHLLLPYSRVTQGDKGRRIVLFPHFNNYVTPGWLDKHLPWRRAPRAHPWLEDVLLVAPTPAFLATLPNGKLPDRQDFYAYGPDHGARIRAWAQAIGECGRFAEGVIRWLERPDPTLLKPI